MPLIRSAEDIAAVEAAGLDRFLPHKTPFDLIRAARDRDPQAVAIRYLCDPIDPARDVVLSYDAVVTRILQAARVFRDLGVGPEDAVGLMVPNSPGAQVALWGAELAGRVCPINPMLRPDHIAELLRASGCKLALVLGENDELPLWEQIVPALRSEGVSIPLLDCEGAQASVGTDGCFETLCQAAAPLDVPDGGDPDGIAALFHTGGTTGAPKLVWHSRLNQAHVGRCCALMYDLGPDDRLVNGFPLFHVAGAFVYGLSTLSAGAQQVIPGRLGMRNRAFVRSIWQQVERLGITVIGGVPTVISALNAVPLEGEIASLRLLLSGGSPLPAELAQAFEDRTGVPVRNILGMTESAGCIAVEPFHGPRTEGCCGLALPFVEVETIDPDDRPLTPQPRGQEGILAVRGPNISPGYSNPAIGRDTFPGNGWLISGDLGRVDGDGRIYVSGRAKDVIMRGAHNIDPQAVEEVFLTHPAVVTAAAIGMPDGYAGELPVVFLQLETGAHVRMDELKGHARARIPEPAAFPKRIEILDQIPLTPIGKIYKPALRRIACRWALVRAAEKAGFVLPDHDIEVDEDLFCRVRLAEELEPRFREAVRGMSIDLTVITY